MTPEPHTIALWAKRAYDGEYATVSEAAKSVGRSVRTLKRWRSEGKVSAPSHYVSLGQGTVNLYSKSDIKELQAYKATTKPGRRRKQA